MSAFFKGVVHCPDCGVDTPVSVRAEAQYTHQEQTASGKELFIPIENARCEFCAASFPIYFYEDGIELVRE